MRYLKCVIAQREGVVYVNRTADDDDNLSVLDIPTESVGFVTGRAGNFLRTIEEEWTTLMNFGEYDDHVKPRNSETLMIFGEQRARRGAELKIMSAVECKVPGYFTEIFPKENTVSDNPEFDTDVMWLRKDEISYALGPKGNTRKKIAAASGCVVEYIGEVAVFSGTADQRKRARQYIGWLFDQLNGPVQLDTTGLKNVTAMDIPTECVGYITGSRRAALGSVEQEWGVIMFFLDTRMKERDQEKNSERLLIFGPTRGRKGAELKVMSSVETKLKLFYSRNLKDKRTEHRGFGTDRLMMRDSDVSYALGREGSTRLKLQAASGAVLQYVGNMAFLCGTFRQRRRCREYLYWLLDQRHGAVRIDDVQDRDDVTEMRIPKDAIGFVCGNRGAELRKVETTTDTFCFIAQDKHSDDRLLIFGVNAGDRVAFTGRYAAEKMVKDLIEDWERGGYRRPGRDDHRGGGGGRNDYRGGRGGRDNYGSGGYGGGRGGGRSPSYNRRRSPSYGRRRSPSYGRSRRSPSYGGRDRRSPSYGGRDRR